MNLEDLRKKVDDIDARIAELIAERIKIAEKIGYGKKEQNKLVEDIEREQRVLEHVKNIARQSNVRQRFTLRSHNGNHYKAVTRETGYGATRICLRTSKRKLCRTIQHSRNCRLSVNRCCVNGCSTSRI